MPGRVVGSCFNSLSQKSLLIPALPTKGGRCRDSISRFSESEYLLIPALLREGVHVSRARGVKDSVDIKTSTLVCCPATTPLDRLTSYL